jgi:hypothetical protein
MRQTRESSDALPGPERPTLPGGGCCRGDELRRPAIGLHTNTLPFGRVGLSGPGRAVKNDAPNWLPEINKTRANRVNREFINEIKPTLI